MHVAPNDVNLYVQRKHSSWRDEYFRFFSFVIYSGWKREFLHKKREHHSDLIYYLIALRYASGEYAFELTLVGFPCDLRNIISPSKSCAPIRFNEICTSTCIECIEWTFQNIWCQSCFPLNAIRKEKPIKTWTTRTW